MILRIYHEKRGGHVHMAVFVGNTSGALGKCGELTVRVDEFDEFRSRVGAEFVEVKDGKREVPK